MNLIKITKVFTMLRFLTALIFYCLLFLATPSLAQAADIYTVPLTVDGKIYTLTVTIEEDSIDIQAEPATLVIGPISQFQEPATLTSQQSAATENAPSEMISTPASPTANRNANLRSGPGTIYTVVGSTKIGDDLQIIARNADGSWLQLASGEWIAAFLIDNGPDTSDLPIASEILTQPTPVATVIAAATTPAPEPTPSSPIESSNTTSSILSIGQDVEGNGWRFKVSAIHKRKNVYWHNSSRAAMGHYLVVIIDATNLQSGTDYFARNIVPWITDNTGNVFRANSSASSYAQWQYGGLDSIYTDVNPGHSVRMGLAIDLPTEVGLVKLSTDASKWIDLGDFSTMPVEDKK